ncbi:TonB-dependent receptor [uncultured Microbulbifer sp.]|uniref:TonB-dependent receptor n=1 Tax=uncultured Microbulbifer sp. TaxID=348147 RepID=UPI00263271B2|nr:TonB-dependent receptor [uncultured Microbulbifer sp.]
MIIIDEIREMRDSGSGHSRCKSGTYFNRTLLAVCIAAATHGSNAQDTQTPGPLEEVTVEGVRGSLKNAQDIKRDAATVADAISASDINALPDKSVLEALQRVPGISIERFAAVDDPDHFSIEGSGAALRGMAQSRSEFNGRDSFSANNGNGLNFQDVPPELMGSVVVYKNQTADMIEGGIAGTINLETRKPFDSDGQQLAFSGAMNYTDMRGESTPDFSGLYSNRWQTEMGEFGFLISAADSELRVSNNSVGQGAPQLLDIPEIGERWVPINAGARMVNQDRHRTGGSLVLQWANPADTTLATLEYVRSDASTTWFENALQSDDTVGTPSADSVYTGDRFVSGTLEGADRYNSFARRSVTDTLVEDLSLNLALHPTDRLHIAFDAQLVQAQTQVLDLSIFGNTRADVEVDFSGDSPEVNFIAPVGVPQSSAAYFTDPANYFYRAAMDHIEDSDGEEKALQLDMEYDIDQGWFQSLKGGLRASEREQTTRWSTYNWGVLSETWAGGMKFFNGVHDTSPWDGQPGTDTYPAPAHDVFDFNDFFRGKTPGIAGGTILVPGADLLADHETFRSELGRIFGFSSLKDRNDLVDGIFTQPEYNPVREERQSAYVMANFASPDNVLKGNFGLRYVTLDYTTAGGVSYSTISASLPLPADDLAFFNGDSYLTSSAASHSHWLPSLNVKYNINDEWLMRFGASRAVAFPDMGMLRDSMDVYAIVTEVDTDGDGIEDAARVSDYRAGTGNPFLKPMTAQNYDVSLEWYFSDVGALSASLFYKDISDFFVSGAFPRAVTNNSVTKTVEVDGAVNLGDGTVRGFEVAYQQFFDQLPGAWSGLGLQVNYTYADAKSVPNPNLSTNDGNEVAVAFENLSLQGMSEHTYNLVGLYEYDDISARLAWNWRSEYLLTTRDVITKLPIYNGDSGQLDGSVFYNLNDHVKLGLEATNILDQVTETQMQVDADGTRLGRSWFINDRRIAAIIRINF